MKIKKMDVGAAKAALMACLEAGRADFVRGKFVPRCDYAQHICARLVELGQPQLVAPLPAQGGG